MLDGGVDCVVAVERAGRSPSGHYYTMRARLMDHLVQPLDELFLLARECGWRMCRCVCLRACVRVRVRVSLFRTWTQTQDTPLLTLVSLRVGPSF